MAVVRHKKTATAPDNPHVEINKGEWNDDHQVSGLDFSGMGIYVGISAPTLKTYGQWLASQTGYWAWIDISGEASASGITATIASASGVGSISPIVAAHTRYVTAVVNPANVVGSITALVANVPGADVTAVVKSASATGMITALVAVYARYVTASVNSANVTGSAVALVATVTGGALSVSDAFTGGKSASWADVTGLGTLYVANNVVDFFTSHYNTAGRWNAAFANNQSSEVQMIVVPNSNATEERLAAGPAVRISALAQTFYAAACWAYDDGAFSSSGITVYKVINGGTPVKLGTSYVVDSDPAAIDGLFVLIEISASNITVKTAASHGGTYTTRITTSDSDIGSGQPGIVNKDVCTNCGGRVDNWYGRDL